MEHWFTLYLITRLDAIGAVALVLSLVLAIVALVTFSWGFSEGALDKVKSRARKLLIAAICSLIVSVLVPSQKDAMFIAGGVGVLEATKSETAQRVANKSVEAIERWLDAVAPEEKK